MFKNSLLICSVVLLSACSSSPPDPMDFAGQFRDTFSTQIKGDGIKLFTYKAKLATVTDRPLPNDQPHDQRINRRKQDIQSYLIEQRNAEARLELWHQQVDLGLQKTIEMSGYCKASFVELSRYVEPDRAEVRGECNDGATEEDIKKFGR
ncbi:hypothetical protein [Shewanella ulleungensis]|uniref:Lipoprotein n=1 Tax=Shewanella ulleungensis TaxID=2282699 RepID=A0ABQ2QBA6_9GAMM|nr:hypothetical protein [Shewanella ulleungensis]MCL1149214.1 hypothetical protein [Shewanella ulleungensis]GGP72847.1 hypothetical protein GCM10009410_00330 [Shewanella ulleungensis]